MFGLFSRHPFCITDNYFVIRITPLSISTISLIDEAIGENNKNLDEHSKARDENLGEMSNWVHDSVPISNDEDADNRTERTFGDCETRRKYSHVDLIHMIGGMDAERGTVTSGGRLPPLLKVLVSTSLRCP